MPNAAAIALRKVALAAREWAALERLSPARQAMARTLALTAGRLATAVAVTVTEEEFAAVKLLACRLYGEINGLHAWSSCPFGLCQVAMECTRPPPSAVRRAGSNGTDPG